MALKPNGKSEKAKKKIDAVKKEINEIVEMSLMNAQSCVLYDVGVWMSGRKR